MSFKKFGPLEFAFAKDPMAPVLGFSFWLGDGFEGTCLELFAFRFVFSVRASKR